MNVHELLVVGLRLAGVGQLILAAVYFQMLHLMRWNSDVAQLRAPNRCIARAYSRYIQTFNAIFGLICLLQPRELPAKGPLAIDLTLLIGTYWLGRLLLGWFYYDWREIIVLRWSYFCQNLLLNTLFIAQITTLFGALAWDLGLLPGGPAPATNLLP